MIHSLIKMQICLKLIRQIFVMRNVNNTNTPYKIGPLRTMQSAEDPCLSLILEQAVDATSFCNFYFYFYDNLIITTREEGLNPCLKT